MFSNNQNVTTINQMCHQNHVYYNQDYQHLFKFYQDKSLINYIVKLEVFGSVRYWMYSVEWQKRGLPHVHILNENSPCMAKERCTKQWLLVPNTITGNDGYPQYRRRSTEDGGKTAILKKRNGTTIEVDNQWVVPYSPLLSKSFNAHINVEYLIP